MKLRDGETWLWLVLLAFLLAVSTQVAEQAWRSVFGR